MTSGIWLAFLRDWVFKSLKTKKIFITHIYEGKNSADDFAVLRSALADKAVVGTVYDGASFSV